LFVVAVPRPNVTAICKIGSCLGKRLDWPAAQAEHARYRHKAAHTGCRTCHAGYNQQIGPDLTTGWYQAWIRCSRLPCKRHLTGLSYCLARLLIAAAPAVGDLVLCADLPCGELPEPPPQPTMLTLLHATTWSTRTRGQGAQASCAAHELTITLSQKSRQGLQAQDRRSRLVSDYTLSTTFIESLTLQGQT